MQTDAAVTSHPSVEPHLLATGLCSHTAQSHGGPRPLRRRSPFTERRPFPPAAGRREPLHTRKYTYMQTEHVSEATSGVSLSSYRNTLMSPIHRSPSDGPSGVNWTEVDSTVVSSGEWPTPQSLYRLDVLLLKRFNTKLGEYRRKCRCKMYFYACVFID